MESVMKRIFNVAALLLTAAVQAQAAQTRHAVKHADSGYTVYDLDSPNPNIGWHNDSNGMQVCHHDCDNPEIPGSGARCHDVVVMGMAMRECVSGHSIF
jgi:hypothetical protein